MVEINCHNLLVCFLELQTQESSTLKIFIVLIHTTDWLIPISQKQKTNVLLF